MGRPRKDRRNGLGWQIMVLLMLALMFLLLDSMTVVSPFPPNFPGVIAEPHDNPHDAPGVYGHDGIVESRRTVYERDLVEADYDFTPVGSPVESIHDSAKDYYPIVGSPYGNNPAPPAKNKFPPVHKKGHSGRRARRP